MGATMLSRKGTRSNWHFPVLKSPFWAAALASLALFPPTPAVAASHYPSGALCYDCHAVSRSKMVVGTHLIRRSQKTIDLGITGSSTPIRCLFCHERNAVSATGRTEMLPVWDHFDARSTSHHPADPQSVFGGNPGALDCQDCHTGITLGVVSDGAGNARVHGVDAATGAVDRYATLIGSPAGPGTLSASTCQTANCHDADGGAAGGYSAPARHGLARLTLPGGAAPSACTQCHGTHNSYQNTALVVLRTDGTTSNSPTAPLATAVTPEKCVVCHPQDDAGVYAARGHGQPGISAGTITCTSCHTAAVPHRFSRSWPGTNRLRFAFTEDTSVQSSLRAQPPYQQAYSICLTCHSQFSGKLHQGPTATAGCNDCHEPHGVGVGANAQMIRAQIPKVDAAGTPVYGDGSGSAYETNTYAGAGDAVYKADGTSLCDNAECHQGRTVNGDLLYPLVSLLSAGRHSGGDRPLVDNCASCHTHADNGGSWGAKNACLTCHGQPPPAASPGYPGPDEATTAHRRHAGSAAGQYGYGCATCHSAYPTGHRDGTYQSVAFGALNPSGAYAPGARTCAGLYCHSAGQSPASTGSAPAWASGALICRGCHGGIDPGTRIATGSHAAHLAWGQITCTSCHADTVAVLGTDASTAITGTAAHVNGLKNLRAGGSFGGAAVAFAPGTGACAQISCHGGNDATWGATLSCADCHLRPAAAGGDRDNFAFGDGLVAAACTEEWDSSGHGRPSASGAYPSGTPAAALAGPAADPRGCRYCHDAGVAHGLSTNPFRLANRSTTQTAANGYGWNNACLVCHRTGDAGYDPDGAAGGYANRNGTRNVDENHYGAKHASAEGGQFCWDCHDPHGDRSPGGAAPDQNIYMVQRAVSKANDNAYGVPVTTAAVNFTTKTLPIAVGYYVENTNTPRQGVCQACHDPASATPTLYWRSDGTQNTHGAGQACTDCHKHPKGFGAQCADCHDGSDPNAPQVVWPAGNAAGRTSAYGSHLKANTGETLSGTTDWNLQCNKCHTGHRGTIVVPLPPASWSDPSGRMTGTNMQTRLGITYASNGGIHLGGTATSGATTEAETCWNCHGTDMVLSEWGYNHKTNTTLSGFSTVWSNFTTAGDGTAESKNYGWIYQAGYLTKITDWTAGFWRSAYDPNLIRRIASVHTASFDPAGQSSSVSDNVTAGPGTVKQGPGGNPRGNTTTVPILEDKSYIRCSYCHDVHDLNRATGDAQTGRPHLRGTWIGDPYPPELPPRQNNTVLNGYTYTYTTRANVDGAFTPRGLSTARNRGGFFIDQNSGFPTGNAAMDTLGETAGLCTLCHGADVDTMDFYTGSTLWRFAPPRNGHSNSTLGGNRRAANISDLFSPFRGDHSVFLNRAFGMGIQSYIPGPPYNCGEFGDQCEPEYPQSQSMAGWDVPHLRNSGWFGGPVNAATQGGGDYANWYGTGTIGGMTTAGSMAHRFTCSKCHSPHATGLPALLVQNCVDPSLGNWRIYGTTGATGTNLIANNCHRKTMATDGWHKLAPGQ